MQKQELIQIHALLECVRNWLRHRGDVPTGAYTAYDERGVSPTHFHYQKAAHHEAVRDLLAGIRRTMAHQADRDSRPEISPTRS